MTRDLCNQILVGVIGINHKSAPLAVREQVAKIASLRAFPGKVVLSTCNRTEIYFAQDDFADLKKELNFSSYTFFGVDCFSHLACVTAGLDSALLGETAIQAQVKRSYEAARSKSVLSSHLHYLFQKSLKLAKDARSCFPLFQSKNHLESLVFKLMDSFLEENPSLLFIGFSEVNRNIIRYLARRKKCRMTVLTRSLSHACQGTFDDCVILKGREELLNAHLYEGIISATTAQEYLLLSLSSPFCTKLILDLSTPRTIDPRLAKTLPLLNMQQMGELFAKMHPSHEAEVAKVKNFIDSSVLAYADRLERKSLLCI